MQKMILLRTVLELMKKWDSKGFPVKFNITVREYNKQNKQGGKLSKYKSASLLMLSKNHTKNVAIEKLKQKDKVVEKKQPNHFFNRTRNLKLSDGTIKKINILLIIEFNGQKVIY